MKRLLKSLALLLAFVTAFSFNVSFAAQNTVKISTAQEFMAIQNDLSKNYELTRNIDLSGASFAPFGTGNGSIVPFSGSLCGNGYTVSDFRVSSGILPQDGGCGLFAIIDGGSISMLSLKNMTVENSITSGYAGAFAGIIKSGSISDCDSDAEILSAASGGIAGINGNDENSNVVDSIAVSDEPVEVTDDAEEGSTVTPSKSEIFRCSFEGLAGAGIAYSNNGSISDCYSTANLNKAGICEYNLGSLSRCYSSSENIPAIAAFDYGITENCRYQNDAVPFERAGTESDAINADLYELSDYNGFDFQKVWAFNNGYTPFLRKNGSYKSNPDSGTDNITPILPSDFNTFYGSCSLAGDVFIPSAAYTKCMLSNKDVTDFSCSVDITASSAGNLYGGIIFRTSDITDNKYFSGYGTILYKTNNADSGYGRVVMLIYKFGFDSISNTMTYLGQVGASVPDTQIWERFNDSKGDAAGSTLTIKINVVGNTVTGCFFEKGKEDKPSNTLNVNLTVPTDKEKNGTVASGAYYTSGGIGFLPILVMPFSDFCMKTAKEPIDYDVSADGEVTSADIAYLKKCLIGSERVLIEEITDVNSDYDINIIDLVRLKKCLSAYIISA